MRWYMLVPAALFVVSCLGSRSGETDTQQFEDTETDPGQPIVREDTPEERCRGSCRACETCVFDCETTVQDECPRRKYCGTLTGDIWGGEDSEANFRGWYYEWQLGALWREDYYRHDSKDGKQYIFYPNCQIEIESEYRGGISVGVWTEWYESGQKREEKTFVDDQLQGTLLRWHENGVLSETYEYVDSDRHGYHAMWYENEQMMRQGEWRNDKFYGLWTWWYPNGQKDREGHYHRNNDECGTWYHWDREGNPQPLSSAHCIDSPSGGECPPCDYETP